MPMGGMREMPVLENPLNASRMTSMAGCQSRMFGGGSGTSADLSTAMTPLELIQHYEKQMPGVGWTRVPIPSDASSLWVRKDSTAGTEQFLTLAASASREIPNCRNVQMMIYESQRSRR